MAYDLWYGLQLFHGLFYLNSEKIYYMDKMFIVIYNFVKVVNSIETMGGLDTWFVSWLWLYLFFLERMIMLIHTLRGLSGFLYLAYLVWIYDLFLNKECWGYIIT